MPLPRPLHPGQMLPNSCTTMKSHGWLTPQAGGAATPFCTRSRPFFLQTHLSPHTQEEPLQEAVTLDKTYLGLEGNNVLPQILPGVRVDSPLLDNNDKIQVVPKSTKERRLLSQGWAGDAWRN